jgi:hypothetical protein
MKKLPKTGRVLALLLMVLVLGCEQVNDPLTISQFQTASNATLFSATTGVNKSVFYTYENVMLTVEELYANEQTDIQIVRKSDGSITKRMLVMTDESGVLRDLPLWFYNGYRKPGELGGNHKFVVHIEQPGVGREWKILTIPFESREALPSSPQLRVTDEAGVFKGGAVPAGTPVYVEGSKIGVKVIIQLLMVADKTSYTPGDLLTDLSDNGIEIEKTEKNGMFEPARICNSAPAGAYDIIADTEPFGTYNTGDVVNDVPFPGLLVQYAAGAGDIIQDIACDASGTHLNLFNELDAVYARVNALTRPGYVPSEFVNLFIAPHRPVWMAGDPLFSMRTVGTFEMPVQCLWNGYAGYLPLIRIHGGSAAGDDNPIRMWPGEYDVILDVDRNYQYNPGIDILDGGAAPGFTVPGTVPAVRFSACADNDFLGLKQGDPLIWGYFRDQIETRVWGVLVDNNGQPISGITITFSIVEGPGTLSAGTATTGSNGGAWSLYSGAGWGQTAVVRLEARVNDVDYVRDIRIFRKVPYTHNQGIVHNQGMVSGN